MNKNSPAGMSVHSNSTDWNTPKKYIDAVYKVLEIIDLDPCSNNTSIVNANNEFILPVDGLKEEWDYKTIFVNPPYGRDYDRKTTIKDWIKKCYESNKKYNSEILLLIPVATNTTHWKEYIFGKASGICFLADTRLKFRINGSEDNKGCPTACAMIYFGSNYKKFNEVFSNYGYVI